MNSKYDKIKKHLILYRILLIFYLIAMSFFAISSIFYMILTFYFDDMKYLLKVCEGSLLFSITVYLEKLYSNRIKELLSVKDLKEKIEKK